MNWRNIKTVWARELRDQLRDRRTLFMVAVLPLLMYPLMGMSFFQLAQFFRDHTATVMVVRADQLAEVEGLPELMEGDRFARSLFDPPVQQHKLVVETDADAGEDYRQFLYEARSRLTAGELDVVVLFPKDFVERLESLQQQLKEIGQGGNPSRSVPEAPKPVVFYNSARDASQVAFMRVDRVLGAWRRQIVGKNLAESRVPTGALKPFSVASEDVAPSTARQARIWSKLLPFIVFIWALTGAFYPAVDLCAGEKERGTLETLLASPASRGEIVWGKLLTVATFSMATSVLNLLGIAATGGFLSQQLATAGPMVEGGFGAPPLMSLLWLLVALPPIAALFSALSFACASFARSTKEGQYYFMPLFLLTMPLMMMPLSPGVELNLGNSLAPVMGLALLLRSLMEGEILEAVRYSIPVTIVTFGCCLLAIRWAVSQFNQESVLFRGDERFDLRLWVRSIFKRRGETPSVAMAVGCVAMILLLQFGLRTVMASFPPEKIDFSYFAMSLLASQACILISGLFVALLLTRNAAKTLLLDRRPSLRGAAAVLGAAALAVAAHPVGLQLSRWIQELYPLAPEALALSEHMAGALSGAGSIWWVILLIGVTPAVVEELTFRGAILSGLRNGGSTRWAVVITAVAFGMVHTVLQQSISAAILGVLIGVLAVKTRSIWPCIVFHGLYNSLPVLIPGWLEELGWQKLMVFDEAGHLIGYIPAVVLLGTGGVCLLLWLILRLPMAGDPPSPATPNPASPPMGAGLIPSESTEG